MAIKQEYIQGIEGVYTLLPEMSIHVVEVDFRVSELHI